MYFDFSLLIRNIVNNTVTFHSSYVILESQHMLLTVIIITKNCSKFLIGVVRLLKFLSSFLTHTWIMNKEQSVTLYVLNLDVSQPCQ